MGNSLEIQKAIETIKNGGTLLYPTETVIGLGCDATNEEAISKLIKLKSRSKEKSFIILVDSIEMLERYCEKLSQLEIDLLNQEQPTTVIINNIKNLPRSLLFKDGTLGVRLTQHPIIKSLISNLELPIVSTSANISGEPTIDSWKNVNPVILDHIDYALNLQSNYTTTQIPSQIIKIVKGEIVYIRR